MCHLCTTFPKVRKCLPGTSPLLESPFPAVSSEKKKKKKIMSHTIPKPEGLELTKTQLSGRQLFSLEVSKVRVQFLEERWQPVLTTVGQNRVIMPCVSCGTRTKFLIVPRSTFLDTWAALVMMVGQFSFNEDRLGQCRLFFKEYQKC